MYQESYVNMPYSPGIYVLRHTRTGMSYVGSSANIAKSYTRMVQMLSTGTHGCATLQAAWNADGATAFEGTVLELVEHVVQLPASERYWLNTLCPLGLYNANHSLHVARPPGPAGELVASPPGDRAHVTTAHLHVNAMTGAHHVVTSDECRAVYLARPLVRNVLRQVHAEAYLHAHPDSQEVMRAILADWESQP
jgi:hypothetical protein